MATEWTPSRRRVLHTGLLLAGMPGLARAGGIAGGAPAAPRRLAAAWNDGAHQAWAGILAAAIRPGAPLQVLHRLALPTRAHGLCMDPLAGNGSLFVVARRPGDWLLRWRPGSSTAPQWVWSAPDRRFCGHVSWTAAGPVTTEVDLETQQGLLVLRDARSLEPVAEWPTHGIDPHMVLADADGTLLVANGGVPTQPESGRIKRDLATMDPSLVRLHATRGDLMGQWRLEDPRLSIRHLARHASGVVGISLQAEHDDAAARAQAPLLALFDGRRLRTSTDVNASQPRPLAGYGGDITATAEGFALAATRAGRLTLWGADGRWQGMRPLDEACPLAVLSHGTGSPELWAGGRTQALRQAGGGTTETHPVPTLRLDNHWVAWS